MIIEAHGITKVYNSREVLHGINVDVREGEILGIIGPSGSGKSTLLRILDLIEPPTSGDLRLFGVNVTDGHPRMELQRRMGMLFQKPIVFNSSVYNNVAMGMKYRKVPKNEIDRRVGEALEAVGLSQYIKTRATDISGGEQQRVALSRVLVTDPEILFLDEPTANLDPKSTATIEEIVFRLNQEQGTTVVMNTHDLMQGQRLAHRIGVMIEGEIAQVGKPREIFHEPNSRKIAKFVGVENILPAKVVSLSGGLTTVDVKGRQIFSETLPPDGSTEVEALIRGEDINLHRREPEHERAENIFPGRVASIESLAPFVRVIVDCGCDLTALITARRAESLELRNGMEIWLSFEAQAVHLIRREE
jgi:tungstate transport system ATP-binding protein